MTSELDFMKLCRLCLIKDGVKVPIFGNTNEVEQLFSKISSCLPVKVSQDDKLPKKICEPCLQKVDSLYQFWNTAANAEKQLLQWLEKVNVNMNAEENSSTQIDKPQEHSTTTNVVCKQECDAEIQDDSDSFQDNGFQVFDASYSPQPNTSTMTTNILRQRLLTSKSDTSSNSEEKNAKKTKEVQNNDSDDEMLGNRVAKQEVNSDEDYEESDQMLQPTAFVDVPCDADQPGPSGLNKTTAESGLYDMKTYILKQQEPGKLLDDNILDSDNLTDSKISIDQDLINLFSTEDDCTQLLQDITSNEQFESFIQQHETKLNDDINPNLNQIEITQKKSLSLGTYICNTCNKSYTNRKQFKRHIKTHLERKYCCTKCPSKFVHHFELTSHKSVHEPPKFECEICSKMFKKKSQRDVHHKAHLSEYAAWCTQCDKGFVTTSIYKAHLEVVHKNLCHICDKCGAQLSSASSLQYHLKTHTDRQRTEICEVCGKLFYDSRTLKNHMKTHSVHNKPGCKVCGKLVSDKKTLEVHLRTHNGEKPLSCEVCNKKFASKGYLSIHMKTHSGVMPYKCSFCDKCFKQRSTLTIHLRYHSGDRPYPCTVCNKGFVSRTLLNRHIKSHGFDTDVIMCT